MDDLATQGTSASAAMLLIYYSREQDLAQTKDNEYLRNIDLAPLGNNELRLNIKTYPYL